MKVLIWIGILFCLFVSACAAAPTATVDLTSPPVEKISVQIQYLVRFTYEEMVDTSDAIVIGVPLRKIGIVDTCYLPDKCFGVGQVIEVAVEDVWLGDVPRTIYVTQGLGLIQEAVEPGQMPTEEQTQFAQELFGIIPLKFGQRYVLFLYQPDLAYRQNMVVDQLSLPATTLELLFHINDHPGRFLIRQDGCVVMESEAPIERRFPPQLLETLRQKVAERAEIPGMTYPLPDDACLNLQISPTVLPYP